jgi:hypothetical protein
MTTVFPDDSDARKTYPVYSGLLQYFPSALAAVANHSFKGNEKHNPGQELHHDRAKSGDEADALVRHLMEGDYVGMAWRALSLLQKHEEATGKPVAPAARNATAPKEHRRVATPAELATYDQWLAKDAHGQTLLLGDTVRILEPTQDDVKQGFGKGSFGKIASRNTDTKSVLVQDLWGPKTKWFNSKQLEWVHP